MPVEHLDVLIVGAGLSGIGAACHLQKRCPGRSFAIVEARERLGGTWDLFRYPGMRSDSDMFTLGYAFRPWTDPLAIAQGPQILQYLQDTAREHGVDAHIRYGQRVASAAWSTPDSRWTLQIEHRGALTQLTCGFLFSCCGYYRYDAGYTPPLPGIERYAATLVHPQRWTPDIAYAGKRVIVIGSGATAVTLVPALAREAAHVTMLQRSPSYIVSRPARDDSVETLARWLPRSWAYAATRWKRVLLGIYFYAVARRKPEQVKQHILNLARAELPGVDVERHFKPHYKPWDQRLCLVPDGDLFKAMRAGQAEIVTDEIETFTERGIRLRSGRELAADLIVTATGLNLLQWGGMRLSVDGVPVDPGKTLGFKGVMFRDLPNLASVFGYTNASWTLKADLACAYVCRLLNHMQRRGFAICTPRLRDAAVTEQPWLSFTSGYVQRAEGSLPRQGSKAPWKLHQNYLLDLLSLRWSRLNDGVLEFSAPPQAARASSNLPPLPRLPETNP